MNIHVKNERDGVLSILRFVQRLNHSAGPEHLLLFIVCLGHAIRIYKDRIPRTQLDLVVMVLHIFKLMIVMSSLCGWLPVKPFTDW